VGGEEREANKHTVVAQWGLDDLVGWWLSVLERCEVYHELPPPVEWESSNQRRETYRGGFERSLAMGDILFLVFFGTAVIGRWL